MTPPRARLAAAGLAWLAAALALGGCGAPLFGESKPPPDRRPGDPVLTRTLVHEDASRVAWCHAANRIAFDRGSRSNASEVWTIDADGQNDACLTCNVRELPAGLRGQPAWHPSCNWLVIQVSNRHHRGGRYEQLAWGIHHDLWAVAADGSWAQRLVEAPVLGASLDPQISRDGTRLLWSVRRATGRRVPQKTGQRTPGAENPWDGWHLAHAKIVWKQSGKPRLESRSDLFRGAPGGGFYQAHAIAGDSVWFSHTPRGLPFVDDVYRAKLDGSGRTNLTRSPGVWDQFGTPSPDGRYLAFASSGPFAWRHPPDLAPTLRLELFSLSREGRHVQLTKLAESYTAESGGRALAGEHAWGPGGREIAVAYAVFSADGALSQRIDVIELARAE